MQSINYVSVNMKPVMWFDQTFERVFDLIAAHRVIGLATLILGIANIFDPFSDAIAVFVNVYAIPLPMHIAAMTVLSVSGVVLLLSVDPPARGWYIPMVFYAILSPIATISAVLISGNRDDFLYSVKILASYGLLTYLIIRHARRPR